MGGSTGLRIGAPSGETRRRGREFLWEEDREKGEMGEGRKLGHQGKGVQV